MSPDRWARVEHLFFEALEQHPGQRESFLVRECGSDEQLRKEVEALLVTAEAETDGQSDLLAQAVSEGIPFEPDAVGRRIGPYLVEREIGAGGMGTVLLARRDDQQFDQQVAIKVLSGLWASHGLVQRFKAERQILANLNHAGIARLLDGGVSEEDSLPYLVMEYVPGVPVTEYCQGKSTAEQLRLFRQICAAVSYAHQNLVVHRDIKPSNILVTAGGEPKLLDFGIAKVLDTQTELPGPQGVAAVTRPTERMLTPEYASPEQVRGEPVTTATDVYSLGVLLYEIVTGQRPFPVSTATPLEAARLICETEAEPPSRRVANIDRDLDNIILKAMRKEPARRYHSVEALSEDIRRYLEGYPVEARAGAWQYRTGKFLKRNCWPLAAGTAFVVLLAGFFVGLAREREIAVRERAKAEAVSRFLVESFDLANPLEGPREFTAAEVAQRGVERIRESLADQPEVRAAALTSLAKVMHGIGRFGQSADLFRDALEAQRQVSGSDSPEVADAILNFARVALDRGAGDAAQRTAIEAQVRDAVAIRRKHSGSESTEHALALDVLALCLTQQGRYEEAEKLYLEAIRIIVAKQGEQSDLLIHPAGHLGIHYAMRRDFARAEPWMRRSYELQRPSQKNGALMALGNLAAVQAALGRPEAEASLKEALDGQTRVLGPDHPMVASTLVNTANFIKEHRDANAEAASMYERALEIRRKRLGSQHAAVALVLGNLGAARFGMGDFDGAVPAYREAVQIRKTALGEKHPLYAKTLYEFALLLLSGKRLEEGERAAREAVSILRPMEKSAPRERAEALYALGNVERERKRFTEAESLLRQSLDGFEKMKKPIEAAPVWGSLSRVLIALGREAEAEAALQQAVNASLAMSGGQSRLLRTALSEIAAAHRALNRDDASAALLARFAAKKEDPRLLTVATAQLR